MIENPLESLRFNALGDFLFNNESSLSVPFMALKWVHRYTIGTLLLINS